jgi:hypothetical protein
MCVVESFFESEAWEKRYTVNQSLWHRATVPFRFTPEITPQQRETIGRAIQELCDAAWVRFVDMDEYGPEIEDHIEFRSHTEESAAGLCCHSSAMSQIGFHYGVGVATIVQNPTTAQVTRELMHVLGFFLSVPTSNPQIMMDFPQPYQESGRVAGPYDPHSILHLSSSTLSPGDRSAIAAAYYPDTRV